jgi:hypothetical protein
LLAEGGREGGGERGEEGEITEEGTLGNTGTPFEGGVGEGEGEGGGEAGNFWGVGEGDVLGGGARDVAPAGGFKGGDEAAPAFGVGKVDDEARTRGGVGFAKISCSAAARTLGDPFAPAGFAVAGTAAGLPNLEGPGISFAAAFAPNGVFGASFAPGFPAEFLAGTGRGMGADGDLRKGAGPGLR